MNTLDIFNSLILTDPTWLLLIIPFALWLLWTTKINIRSGGVSFTDLEYLRSKGFTKGWGRSRFRTLMWGIILLTIIVLWSAPHLRSSEPIFTDGKQIEYQKFILMLDVSRSMSVQLGEEDDVRLPGQVIEKKVEQGQTVEVEKIPRFQAARSALMDFVKRFDKAQIGLILFSAEPILARWPTVETQDQFWEILEEDIGRGLTSQIQSFSSLTNTDQALDLARDIFIKQEANQGAVILISDAEDDIENMGLAARNLRNHGIRLYTIGVGISEKIADSLSLKFADDPGFRIFHVDSEEEMQEAYRLVTEVEESLPFELNKSEFESDLRWFLSLCLVMILSVFLWVLEVNFHQSTVVNITDIFKDI